MAYDEDLGHRICELLVDEPDITEKMFGGRFSERRRRSHEAPAQQNGLGVGTTYARSLPAKP